MAKFEKFKTLVRNFADIADFVIIYIREAHPIDEWSIAGTPYSNMKQHKSLEERIEAAEMLKSKGAQCPVLVDLMEDTAAFTFAAIPERLYILQDGVIKYAGKGQGPYNYKPEEVAEWLEKHRGESQHSNGTGSMSSLGNGFIKPEECGS